MPASLTASTRSALLTALPEGAAGADPSDDDIVRAAATVLVTLRTVAHPAPSPVAEPDLTPVRRALSGDAPADAPAWARALVADALALHRRAEDTAAQLAEARKALTAAEKKGAPDLLARAVKIALAEGRVADDLPPAVREVAQGVADLRAEAEAARAEVERARSTQEPPKLEEWRKARDREWQDKRASYESEIREKAQQIKGLQRAKDLLEKEATQRTAQLASAQKDAQDAQAAIALLREALGLPKSTRPEVVIARMQERLAAQPAAAPVPRPRRQQVAAPAPTAPEAPLPPEPPHVVERAWRDLRPGDLALDRASYRTLRASADLEPHDPRRRVLFLRSGDGVVHLRPDGLHEDGVTAADAPTFRPGRQLRDAHSLRALVIAEDVGVEPHAIRDAFRAWLTAADEARVLAAQLDESPGPEAEGEGLLPTSAGAASTVRHGGGL